MVEEEEGDNDEIVGEQQLEASNSVDFEDESSNQGSGPLNPSNSPHNNSQ